MTFRVAAVALVAAALPLPATAEVRVEVAGPSVDLAATAAPISEVLDRLSRQTGMTVVYEGPAPRQLVTLTVHGRTPAQAVLAVLEGQGINFALVTDPSGAAVRTLLVAGTASTSSGSPPVRAAAAPATRRPPFGTPPAVGPDSEPPFDEGTEDEPEDPTSFGVPPGVEGIEQRPPAENAPGAAGQPGQNAPAANPGIMAPPQRFPVSPFAPQPPTFAPQPAAPVPGPGQIVPSPGIAPGQPPPGQPPEQ